MSGTAIPRGWTIAYAAAIGLAAVALWLPQASLPLFGDPVYYSLLGEGFWTTGTYSILGQLHEQLLPAHAILSYPFAWAFGHAYGLKVASLAQGLVVLSLAFALARKFFSVPAAYLTPVLLLTTHGFPYGMNTGGVDNLYTALLLGSVLCFSAARKDTRWYLAYGALAGVMCVSRYNGIPIVMALFAYALWTRPAVWRSRMFWAGNILSALPAVLWVLRSARLVNSLGDAGYIQLFESTAQNRGAWEFITNAGESVLYYLNPIHNFMPVLLLIVLWGLWRYGRAHPLLIVTMLSALVVTAVWPVHVLRYGVPLYPFALAFAAQALVDAYRRWPRWEWVAVLTLVQLGSGGFALCLYAYGSCNVWFDRTIGGVPRDLHITAEGMHSWNDARSYVDANAQSGATVLIESPTTAAAFSIGVFRKDLQVRTSAQGCTYRIGEHHPTPGGIVVYASPDPPTYVVERRDCE
jgi:hypothetical protein